MRSGFSSKSSQGGMRYDSRSIKKFERFQKQQAEYHKALDQQISATKYCQPLLALLAGFKLSYWAIIPFVVLFLSLLNYTHLQFKKPKKWQQTIRFWLFSFLAVVQVVYIFVYVINSFVVVLILNLTQVLLVVFLKKKIDEYLTFMKIHSTELQSNSEEQQQKQFFTKDLLKNLGMLKSNCDKKQLQSILKKYEKHAGKEMPYVVGKAIFKEVNENNEPNQLQDLSGQNFKNAKYLVEEQLTKLERIQQNKQFSGGISDDSSSADLVYVFICPDLKSELYAFISKTLKRECTLISKPGIIAVRIKVN